MSFTAVYDACVLHPAGLRDLLVRLAGTGLFRAKWSNDILDEMVAHWQPPATARVGQVARGSVAREREHWAGSEGCTTLPATERPNSSENHVAPRET